MLLLAIPSFPLGHQAFLVFAGFSWNVQEEDKVIWSMFQQLLLPHMNALTVLEDHKNPAFKVTVTQRYRYLKSTALLLRTLKPFSVMNRKELVNRTTLPSYTRSQKKKKKVWATLEIWVLSIQPQLVEFLSYSAHRYPPQTQKLGLYHYWKEIIRSSLTTLSEIFAVKCFPHPK